MNDRGLNPDVAGTDAPDPNGIKPATLLVLGGARSGKSTFAQRQAERAVERDARALVFVATAHAYDAEMEARIAAHVAARDARWRSIDAPYDLAETLRRVAAPDSLVLVDCLTLWLSNILLRGDDTTAAIDVLAAAVSRARGTAVFVSNEVGSGIVPDNALARQFRDAQGRLNQAMAAACETVVVVVAGLPLQLKPRPAPTISL